MKIASRVYNIVIFAFLYVPVLVLVFFSFNSGAGRTKFEGFSLKWYEKMVNDQNLIHSLQITLEVAILAAIFATIIGTVAAVGIHSMNGKLQRAFLSVNNIPMVNPEIVTAISLMLLFVFIYRSTGLLQPGFFTLLLAHITFNIPYVVLQVMPKLRQMNKHMVEAALDLGCPPGKAFFKVIIPEIMPGVVTGAVMAFTMSLDDFIISYFNSGNNAQTLSVFIFGMTKKRVTPEINALSSLLFVTILLLLLLVNISQVRGMTRKNKRVAG